MLIKPVVRTVVRHGPQMKETKEKQKPQKYEL